MNDIRRTLIWVVFIFSLIMLWDQWQVFNGKPALFFPRNNTVAEQSATGTTAGQQNTDRTVPASSGISSTGSAQTPASSALQGERITVATDVFKLTFDTIGGRIIEADLLKFEDQTDHDLPVKLIDPAFNYQVQTGVIDAENKQVFPRHDTPMHLMPGPLAMSDGQNTLAVRFESDEVNGIRVIRSYEFERGSYIIKVSTQVVNSGSTTVRPELYFQLVRNSGSLPGGSMFWNTFTGPAFYNDDSRYTKVAFSDIFEGKSKANGTAQDGWVGMVQHYFVSSWILDEGTTREFYTQKPANQNGNYVIGMKTIMAPLAQGEQTTLTATLYVGPQDEKVLENLAPGLDLVKDYGMFRVFSKPLFWLLDMFHTFLGNWGWSIVALVVLIKAAFFWLNAKAYQSMAKMKALTPRLQEINERYKDNPQQKQLETMRIYREEKINPLGGCLPILIQIPVFIALYWVLLSSVEMRNAPWILWITDLSAKDPYYILPIIMTASTLLQTWLNPTPADPMQAKMMWIMPLMFSVMFFMFPAGLVLYWVTNNLLSIAQQWFINKRLGVHKT